MPFLITEHRDESQEKMVLEAGKRLQDYLQNKKEV